MAEATFKRPDAPVTFTLELTEDEALPLLGVLGLTSLEELYSPYVVLKNAAEGAGFVTGWDEDADPRIKRGEYDRRSRFDG